MSHLIKLYSCKQSSSNNKKMLFNSIQYIQSIIDFIAKMAQINLIFTHIHAFQLGSLI